MKDKLLGISILIANYALDSDGVFGGHARHQATPQSADLHISR